MTMNLKNLCWAGVLIAMAAANAAGLIADKDATMMFAIIPALWVATSRPGCKLRKAAA